MKQFAIVANTTIDESEAYYTKHEIANAPLSYTIGGRTIVEDFGKSMSGKEFYSELRQGNMCTTSQTPVELYHPLYKSILESGLDVLFIGLSSGISGSYQAGCIAAADLAPQYPDRQIVCVDSLSATGGMHILVDEAIRLRDEGLSAAEAKSALDALAPRIIHLITPDDLKHLYRGGRLSKSSAVLGSLVGIKPIIALTDEGKLEVVTKVRGRAAALTYLADALGKEITDKSQTVWITHGDCEGDAAELQGMLLQKHGVRAELRTLGTVLGAHAGPGTIVLGYIGQKRFQK